MREYIVYYTAEHGMFGVRSYRKKIKAKSSEDALERFIEYRREEDRKQHRYGAWQRVFEVDGIEESQRRMS